MRPCRFLWRGLLAATCLLLFSPGLRAQSETAGTYRCASVQVDGRSGPCISPPLTLYSDGYYRIWGEEGTYAIRGDWLVLSHSKKRGRGRLQSGGEIVFQYTYRRQKHAVVFKRQCALPAGMALI